jgi:hypothetical protein
MSETHLDYPKYAQRKQRNNREVPTSALPEQRSAFEKGFRPAKRISIHPATVAEPGGLRFPEELTLDVWRAVGERLADLANASCWWIGDWLVYGQDKYPDRYKRAIAKTALDYQTLRNYSWIARKFEFSRRRPALSFQHHVEVAALPVAEQDHWLRFAEKLSWSRNELRKQIKDSADAGGAGQDGPATSVRLDLDDDRMRQWKRAAERSNRTLPGWIMTTLDAVVESEEEAG